jgi:hypothetical protein
MKKYRRNIIIIIAIVSVVLIIVFLPLILGIAYFHPYIHTDFVNIELNNIPVYSQIWKKDYNFLNDNYKKYYFNGSLILVDILRDFGNSDEIYIQAFSRYHEENNKYYINSINISSKNIEYFKEYNYPIEMVNDEIIVEDQPFDSRITLDNYYFKNKKINIIINITIEKNNISETKELVFIFEPKTKFGIYRSLY